MQRIQEFITFAVILSAAATFVSGCRDGCGDCAKEKCTDIKAYCTPDPDCACMASCLEENGIPGVEACLGSCGLTERPPQFMPYEECVAVACPDAEDECSTPADYEPPSGPTPVEPALEEIIAGDLADCSFDSELQFDPSGSVLQLQNAGQTVCLRLERLDGGSGSLANTSWILLDIRVGPIGGVAYVDDPAHMCWYSSHHNFADWVHVWTGQRLFGLRLHVDGWGGERTYQLHVYESGDLDANSCPALANGVGLLGVVPLFPVNP